MSSTNEINQDRMDEVIKQGEKLDDSQDKTNELQRQADQFKAGIDKLKKNLNKRSTCVIM